MKPYSALIIDDEPDLRELLTITLARMNIKSDSAATIAEAKELLQHNSYNLCLTDLRLPDGNGIDFLIHIKNNWANMPVAIITAHGNMDTAINALRHGAFDFFIKPIELDLLRNLINRVLPFADNLSTNDIQQVSDYLLGDSPPVMELSEKIKKLSRTDAPIIISGPSGSGKELVARLLHKLSSRSSHPFVPVNCGAIPKELMESEFFGHKKGSFTGATKDKPGLFHAAQNGTLLLDEIGELPLDMQVKLLRAIQERSIRPIGSNSEDTVDIRILGATHKNLRDLVKQGKFREDLFYRINVIELSIPSLLERSSDIPILIDSILDKLVLQKKLDKPKITTESLELLKSYDFPGNIRELENILERALALHESNIITPKDLDLPTNLEDPSTYNKEDNTDAENLKPYLDKMESEKIIKTLQDANGSKTLAAKKLGISMRALRYKLSKLGLEK